MNDSPSIRSQPTLALLCLALVLAAPAIVAEELQEPPGGTPPFHEYDPPSTLVVPEHPVTRARYPFVDVHNHQFGMPDQDLSELVAEMDKLNMAVMVNLSGRGFKRSEAPDGTTHYSLQEGEYLERAVQNARDNAPGRFIVFTNLDVEGIDEPDWTRRTLTQLETDVTNGAQGLKIYKSLGMTSKDSNGERIPVNDERLDPVWARCAELGIPVLIHTADPAPFWQDRDDQNERLFELMERPGRYRDPDLFPPFEQIMGEQHVMFRKHPGTTFINAHLGWMGNDLARLGELMDELPNMHTEIGAVLAELGRQPRFARQWLIEHQDRVLFGKDSWRPDEYHVYFRVLETDDDYFDYYRRRHAFWKIYGLDLPDEVLRKIYFENALRIVPGIDPSLFPE